MSSARLLALLAFLASAVGAKATLSEIYGLEHEDGTFYGELKLWLDSAKREVAPENGSQKDGQSLFLIEKTLI